MMEKSYLFIFSKDYSLFPLRRVLFALHQRLALLDLRHFAVGNIKSVACNQPFLLKSVGQRQYFLPKNAFIFRIIRFFAARDVLKMCIHKAYRCLENVYSQSV